MHPSFHLPWRALPAAASLPLLLGVFGACSDAPPAGYQGYVEGEFVNMAAPLAGRLDVLAVKRGDEVALDARLYALESANEAAAQREARAQLTGAQARLADLQLGRRPPELAVSRAQLAQAQVEEQRIATQLARDEAQFRVGGIAQAQLDDSRSARAAAVARVAQLRSELTVAQLPSRIEQIKAQAALVVAAQASLEQATWRLEQKAVSAARAGRVTDTLFRAGEWVPAGSPVVRMLPPQNVKVRFFVPEAVVGSLSTGRAVSIRCDGCGGDIAATLDFVSTQAEFTPPVIFSNETRSKLVFMIEARPDPENAKRLHPGQPVSVVVR